MKTKTILFTVILAFSLILNAKSQETKEAEKPGEKSKTEISAGADLVSRYVWRGTDYGNAPAIQPSLSFDFNGFKIGAWGSYAFSDHAISLNDSTSMNAGKYGEFDIYASYTYKWFTLMLYDYYTVNGFDPNGGGDYFNFNNKTTGHALEASLIFNGPEKFPLNFSVNTLIYGADKNKDEAGEYGKGTKNNFSTYLELGYTFHVASNFVDLCPFVGGSLFGSSWYGAKAGLINVGLMACKEIPVTEKYSLPVKVSVIANPSAKSTFLVFAVSL